MSLRLTDLREAALREYPEFGRAPWPVPWWRDEFALLAASVLVFVLCVLLVLVPYAEWSAS